MDRVYSANASATAPAAPAVPSSGYPSAGSPSLDIPATTPGPYWFHQITQELYNVIVEAGITPSHTNLTQLKTAILGLIAANQTAVPDATTSVKGKVELATNTECTTGTDTVRAVTPAGLAAAIAAIVAATSSAKGLVELATNAETQAGTDSTRAVTPAGFAASSIGYGQTWQEPIRAVNVTYQNTTGRPIMVNFGWGGDNSGHAEFLVGSTSTPNIVVAKYDSDGLGSETHFHVSVIVPPNHYYKLDVIDPTMFLYYWAELR